jgi:hypothetical protein
VPVTRFLIPLFFLALGGLLFAFVLGVVVGVQITTGCL